MSPDPTYWATFHLCGDVYAVRATEVQEVLLPQSVWPVPRAPNHVQGLINLRGQIMPVIDLKLRFGISDNRSAQRLIVVRTREHVAALGVDRIGDVIAIDEAMWRPPGDTIGSVRRSYIQAMAPLAENIVLALDTCAVASGLSADDRRAVRTMGVMADG